MRIPERETTNSKAIDKNVTFFGEIRQIHKTCKTVVCRLFTNMFNHQYHPITEHLLYSRGNFIAALFIRAEMWRLLKYSTDNEWIS